MQSRNISRKKPVFLLVYFFPSRFIVSLMGMNIFRYANRNDDDKEKARVRKVATKTCAYFIDQWLENQLDNDDDNRDM